MLNRSGVKAELGPLDVQYRNGLNDYYTGHYTSAIATFDKILALAPSYQQAAVFKTNAVKARDQYGDVSTSSGLKTILYVVGGVGGAIVLIAAVVAILVIRRRKNRQPPGPAGAPPVFAGPAEGPPPISGPMPVFNPAGPPYAWPGSQSPTSSVEQIGPPQVGAADHPPVTAPPATAPVTFDSSTERADRAGGDRHTLTDQGTKIEQLKNARGAAGFRCADRSGVRGREAQNPRRALLAGWWVLVVHTRLWLPPTASQALDQ